ncbi:MAG: hypothetical protein AAGK37_12160 [Pseudomonadota bacterium]
MIWRAACLVAGLMMPVGALACETDWRIAQAAFGAAGLQLSDMPEALGMRTGSACRVAGPELALRSETKIVARSATWRTSTRKPSGPAILVDLDLRGLTLKAGSDDPMAAHLADVFDLQTPADLSVSLTWSGASGRVALRTRSGSPGPSNWFDVALAGVGAPNGETWWSGFETAEFSEVSIRLRGDGLAERYVLALLARDRLRGTGDPVARMDALRDRFAKEIADLPPGSIDAGSRAALASALADMPGGRGTLAATLRWPEPQSAARIAGRAIIGRVPGQPQVTLSYGR